MSATHNRYLHLDFTNHFNFYNWGVDIILKRSKCTNNEYQISRYRLFPRLSSSGNVHKLCDHRGKYLVMPVIPTLSMFIHENIIHVYVIMNAWDEEKNTPAIFINGIFISHRNKKMVLIEHVEATLIYNHNYWTHQKLVSYVAIDSSICILITSCVFLFLSHFGVDM